jgi:TolA-binding protein
MRKTAATTLIVLSALGLPAAALAATADDGATEGIGQQQVVADLVVEPLQGLQAIVGEGIQDLTMTPAAQQRAAERREAAIHEQRIADLGVSMDTLESIAACESGGDPTIVSSDGSYRGKYQFDYGTWASVGGSGDPAAAPETEQDYRAALLYTQSGSSPWPICGV